MWVQQQIAGAETRFQSSQGRSEFSVFMGESNNFAVNLAF